VDADEEASADVVPPRNRSANRQAWRSAGGETRRRETGMAIRPAPHPGDTDPGDRRD
jgi:hypothetical protein